MCGIAGILWPQNTNDEYLKNVADRMISTLHLRGPDDHGTTVVADSGLVLAHSRLAIQDLSPLGAQPMDSISGRYLIVFNGEVYNFRELREQLASRGYPFRGGSDTEVVLAAIEEWGINEALIRFTGMFAFALWDRNLKQLHLTRDRIGEKPLYYGFVGEKLVFASELKALLEVPEWSGDINRHALTLFMRYGYIPSPYSIYSNISKLIPGTLVTFPGDLTLSRNSFSQFADDSELCKIHPIRYWSLADVIESGSKQMFTSDKEAMDELDSLLTSSVQSQMVADVPVGAFLSGGIDSSIVAAFMQKNSSCPIKTFTIGYDSDDFNEAPYALQVAKFLGTDHTEVYVSPRDALEVIPQLPTIYDEPHADSSQLPAYLISRVAKQKVTVCLSGDGGDELFAGYNRYLMLGSIWERSRLIPFPIRKMLSRTLLCVSPSRWDSAYHFIQDLVSKNSTRQTDVGLKAQKIAYILARDSLADMYKELISYWNAPEEVVTQGFEPDSVISKGYSLDSDRGFINQALFWDTLSYLPDDNLAKVDRASMAVSLETRLPLLDYRILEFSWKLPLNMKVRDGVSKWIIRQVLYQNIDRKLLDRPKMGFSVPVAEWLRGPLRDWGESLISKERLIREGFFNAEIVRKRWVEHQSGTRNWHLSLWAVLTFQAWLESGKRNN